MNLQRKKTQGPSTLEILAITLIMMLISFPRILNTPFHIDESSWIGNSYFFEDWFRFDSTSAPWQINGKTLGDPNMTKYIIAVGRIITGFSRDELNKPYDYTRTFDENSEGGHVPIPNLMVASRIPMAALIVLVGVVLFVLFYQLVSPLMAYGWIFLLVQNTLFLQVMSRAMNEAPVMFFTVVSAVFTYFGFRELAQQTGQDGNKEFRTVYLFFLLAGLTLGLAFSTKINALLLFFSSTAWLAVQVFATRSLPRQQRTGLFLKLFLLYFAAALLVVIVLHPFLWRNPVGGIYQMIIYRFSRLSDQSSLYTEFSRLPLLQRWWQLLQRMFTTYTAFDFQACYLLNIPLALFGLIRLGKELVSNVLEKRLPGFLLVLIALFLPLAAAGMMSPLDWDRYFMFPVFIMTLVYAKGIEALFCWLRWLVARIHRKETAKQEP